MSGMNMEAVHGSVLNTVISTNTPSTRASDTGAKVRISVIINQTDSII